MKNYVDVTQERPKFSVKLRLSISTLFLCLILPAFAIFVVYMYNTNYEIYKKNAAELISNHNDQSSDKLLALLDPIGDSLVTLAKQVRDDPRLFDSAAFHDTMLLHLENNPNLVSVFVASDKGSFHQVQGMREGMVIAGRVPPVEAKFNFWVVDRANAPAPQSKSSEGPRANSTFTFFKTRNTPPIDTFVVNNSYDPRDRPYYKNLVTNVAKAAIAARERFVYVDEPFVSSSTSRPTIMVQTPIYKDNAFRGMIGESFELTAISRFLKSIQISKNAETYIIDTEGNIVVSTGADNGYKVEKTNLIRQSVLQAEGQPVQQAFRIRKSSGDWHFEFKGASNSEVYLARFTPFPNTFNKDWEVLTLVPVSDFLEGLNAINRQLIIYGGFACLLLVLLTYVLSRTISRPIEDLTEDIRNLMNFAQPKGRVRSKIVEINILSGAVDKLSNTLMAFSSYVPRDLVNDLLRSGNAIELGGESRYLSIMFTDLKDFSTISEVTPSRALLKCVSAYLALVTYAVKEESGTVDKFIGDSVMAFWGAPLLDQDHAYHACATAVKSQRRMVELNRQLVSEGLPALTVRIGIHSDAVLVGNIGSEERMSYTVMGDGVNIAARLEGINKEFATAICISHATFKEAGERLWTRPIDVITVKGRKGEIPIYELVAIHGDDPETMATSRDQQLCAITAQAFGLFSKKQYKEAAELYEQIIETYGDGLSGIMKAKCLQNLASP
jgi:adenylate cyclase